jgi:PAS domain S-box-containing protein
MTLTIRRRLAIQAGLSVLVLLITVLSVSWVTVTTARSFRNADLLSEVSKEVFELHILTIEYLLHPEKQLVRQWHVKHEALSSLLGDITLGDRQSAGLLSELGDNHRVIKTIYTRIIENVESENPDHAERPAYHDPLVGQLMLREQAMVSASTQLLRMNRSRLLDAYLANSLVVIVLVTLLAAAVSGTSYFLVRHVVRSLLRLKEGTERIAGGNLSYRLHVEGRDELADLAGSFDRMAERLEAARRRLDREVAERERAAAALREATQILQGIIHASPLAVLLLDPGGRVTLWNPAAERTFGWTEEEVLGRFNPTVPEEEEEAFRVFLSRALAGETFPNLEAKRRRKDGTLRDVLVSTAPLRDALGTIRGNISIIADVTERKRAEEQLKEAHSDLRQFSYVASHDLQEPLRSIASFTQLLAKRYRGRLDADADDFIDFIVEGASRMQTLIDDLLAYSRVGTHGKSFARVDCEEILSRALANLRAAVAESGAVVTHDPLPAVGGDGSQLVQLFQNLLSNAVKFRKNDVPRIHVSVKMDGSEWTFGVEDNGIGIDPRHADWVFTVFQRLHTRREYPGTGIGLAVCKRIVERHGGRIWVESLPGEGSTFRFTIPAREV